VAGVPDARETARTRARSSELEAAGGARGRLWRQAEGEAGLRRLGRDGAVVLVVVEAKVRLKDVHGLLVHVLVRVVLQLLELVEALGLVHEGRVRVGAVVRGRLVLASLQDVLDALERDGDEAGVVAREQVAERLDTALLHEVLDLLGRAARGGVGDGPGGLLLDVELGRPEQVHERRDDVGLDDGLDLLARAGGDVRDRPARLLADALLGRVEQREQPRQRAAVDDALRLAVVARDDVAGGAQGGGLNRCGRVTHQLDDARADARVQHGLDLLVRTVREVRERPAAVREHLVVVGEDELSQDRQSG